MSATGQDRTELGVGNMRWDRPGGVGEEGTRLGIHFPDGSNLSECVEVVLQVGLTDVSREAPHKSAQHEQRVVSTDCIAC